jgi:hypothetical protein
MDIKSTTKIDSEFELILPCFEKYGSHLEKVHVNGFEKPRFMECCVAYCDLIMIFRIYKDSNTKAFTLFKN